MARDAGALILRHVPQNVATQNKPDGSPVTDADRQANDYIVGRLRQLTPLIPVVAEESRNEQHGTKGRFWLVDPLDGTESYKRGEPEFTVNIALIEDAAPVLGVIYDPSHDVLYWAARGQGAWRQSGSDTQQIHVRTTPEDGLRIIKSRRKPSSTFLEKLGNMTYSEMHLVGSSIKFCRVAEGRADLYPRFGDTMEWDTAAGHAILNEAGGRVVVAGTNQELTYGKPGYKNPHFIAAAEKPAPSMPR